MTKLIPWRIFLAFAVALGLAGCATTPSETARSAPVPSQAQAPSGDAFVVLSGGGTPLTNNYSQYLQARALNDGLRARYAADAVWMFFGAGNRTGEPAVFGDVRRQVKDGALLMESWLPGVLDRNRPATKAEILGALKNEILPRVAGGGTLYLFVGDHGELSRGKNPESAITLWQMVKTGTGGGNGWRSDKNQILTVTELRTALAAGLGEGRVVFCFTCCHSGGFHHLDVPRAAAANPAWFRGLQPAECADWSATPAPVRMAGFTATTEDSLAAGCVPDPDPENWLGYERYFPEALLGFDLMTGERRDAGRASFAAAHEAATLVDRTIDKPFSSAEMWLERHATLIETAVAESPALTPAVRTQVERYRRIVDGDPAGVDDPAFAATERQFARFVAALAEQNLTSATLLRAGTRAELEAAVGPVTGNGGGGRRRGSSDTAKQSWTGTLRPAWKAALTAGSVPGVTATVKAFELHLIGLEEKDGKRVILPGDRDATRNELFWQSGYAEPGKADAAKAAALARWEAGRRASILAWARASTDASVRAAAEKLAGPARGTPRARVASVGPPQGERKEALQRALFYRRVLGAWAFLIAVDERGALQRLAELRALEERPLPPPTITGAERGAAGDQSSLAGM